MEIKELIIQTLRSTQRENIESVISYMENNEFFTRSCHGHHKYDGGLAHHAWQTYQLAISWQRSWKSRTNESIPTFPCWMQIVLQYALCFMIFAIAKVSII